MTRRWLLVASVMLSLVFAQDDDFDGGAILPERAVDVLVTADLIGFTYEDIPEGSSVVLEAITSYALTFNNASEQSQTLDIVRVQRLDDANADASQAILMPSLTLEAGASETVRLTLSEEQKGIWQVSTGTGSSWLIIN